MSGRTRHRGPGPGSAPSGLATAALAAAGWLLLLVTAPVAIFLTWWGDCFEEACASASELERTVYLFDVAAILVLPAVAYGGYRGWRPAAIALLVAGLAVVGQVVASALGARGFQAFPIVLPAGGLLVAAGLVALRPGGLGAGESAGDGPTTRTGLAGLAVLSVVIVALALGGVMTGGTGIGQVILVVMAVSLTFIVLVAARNRGAVPPPRGGPPHRRR